MFRKRKDIGEDSQTAREYWEEVKKLAEEKLRGIDDWRDNKMEIKCCICGRELESQNSITYLCNRCEDKYGDYDEDTPQVQPIRKRKKYDDER